jgi:hypothetical protein
MVYGISQLASRVADQPGDIAARIDHGVPRVAQENLQAPVSVAPQLLEMRVAREGIEMGMGLTAIEERHLMTQGQRCVNQVTPRKIVPPRMSTRMDDSLTFGSFYNQMVM